MNENDQVREKLVSLVDALGSLTDPEETFSCITPGPERAELERVYQEALIVVANLGAVHG